jgi:hypothetical protein
MIIVPSMSVWGTTFWCVILTICWKALLFFDASISWYFILCWSRNSLTLVHHCQPGEVYTVTVCAVTAFVAKVFVIGEPVIVCLSAQEVKNKLTITMRTEVMSVKLRIRLSFMFRYRDYKMRCRKCQRRSQDKDPKWHGWLYTTFFKVTIFFNDS